MHADDLLPHMRRVQGAERDLHDLGMVWQMIESSAAISCPEEVAPILPTLVVTRNRFEALQQRLIAQMVVENEAELRDELQAKAQCAIDILVRNLYERTADVGFLATDEVVREFCAAPDPGGRDAMAARLADYRAKYTVYDDVMLLSTQGEMLVRLDRAATLVRSHDDIVARALVTPGFVEGFGRSDLAEDGQPALLYAHRVAAPDGRALGVLVLRFRFADEMQRIFASIHGGGQHMALLLVDAGNRVIASSDTMHVPTGAGLEPLPDATLSLSNFAGCEYLALRCASAGYQGYAGPAWRAQAMVSLLTAFRSRSDDDAGTGTDTAGGSLPLDNPALLAMNHDAEAINRELRRVVWNGRLMAGERSSGRMRLKAVLQQVQQAGVRTRERVALAIHGIHRTSLARTRRQALELARLAADILDRNLYERANDCRWWALSPLLRTQLAAPASPAGTAALTALLDHVNGLYTVYSRLVAFDAQGAVRAASRSEGAPGLVGSAVPAPWLHAVGQLGDAQRYAVSEFESTLLHEQGDTWVYLAAVRAPGQATGTPVGGIAIVFNAAAELPAMLRDVLGGRKGFAAFVDAQGRVLAATDAALAGALAPALRGATDMPQHAGTHYACARVCGGGYREFKTADGCDNRVAAVVGLTLGVAERRGLPLSKLALRASGARLAPERQIEVAMFQVGAERYALPASQVMEAVTRDVLVPTPGASGVLLGMAEVRTHASATRAAGSELVHVACARRLFGLHTPPRADDGVILVLRSRRDPARPVLALRVDDVLGVLELARDDLHPVPAGFSAFAPWVGGLLDCEADGDRSAEHVLVQWLDEARLLAVALPAAAADEVGTPELAAA
jgi:chemotaxis signal transduction protein